MTSFPQVAWLAFGVIAAVGQQPSSSDQPIIPVIGTVKAIADNVISVASGTRMEMVVTDGNTEVWKGKTYHDLSPVQIGDDFSARCIRDASGRLVAEVIWLNIVNFFGVITKVDSDTFEMLTNSNADPNSAYVKKKLKLLVGWGFDLRRQRQGRPPTGKGSSDGWIGSEERNGQGDTADRL